MSIVPWLAAMGVTYLNYQVAVESMALCKVFVMIRPSATKGSRCRDRQTNSSTSSPVLRKATNLPGNGYQS